MSKRTADEAGLDAKKDDEEPIEKQPEEAAEGEDEYGEDGEYEDGGEGEEEEGSSESEGDSSDSGPDGEGLRAFALSWLEDKRADGVPPQNIFESLGMKVVCLSPCHLINLHCTVMHSKNSFYFPF